jgi:hypothetical protein
MFTKQDFITTDRILEAFPEHYYKTDVIVSHQPMNYRGKTFNPPQNSLPIIISGHSDYAITDQHVEQYTPKVWWTVNKQSSRIFAFPLGITNHTNESHLHQIYGDLDMMVEVLNQPRNIQNLVYMNFNIGTFPQERQVVWDMFKDFDWVTTAHSENSLDARKKFLQQIRNHSFTLCPRGNGIDTHRLWETLYMGGIPIVKENLAMDDFKDFPILFIKDWNQVTPEFLKEQEYVLQNKNFDLEKLKVNYWIEKIKNSI